MTILKWRKSQSDVYLKLIDEKLYLFSKFVINKFGANLCILLVTIILGGFIAQNIKSNAFAQDITPYLLSDEDQEKVVLIENYLNSFSSLKARFIQVSENSELTEGTLYLRRPGKLRVEYDPPVPILIVGDGLLLHYYDSELEQINNWPIFDTPLGKLTSKKVNFNDELLITHFESRPGLIKLRVVQNNDASQGGITLFFSNSPVSLEKWVVDDAQGFLTTIMLFGIETNLNLDSQLFIFEDKKIPPNRR